MQERLFLYTNFPYLVDNTINAKLAYEPTKY